MHHRFLFFVFNLITKKLREKILPSSFLGKRKATFMVKEKHFLI